MSALLCWRAASSDPRLWACIGLAVSLGAAVSSHYYAVLLFVPVGIGELVRTFERRRIDWMVWAGILAGAAPLLAWSGLMKAVRSTYGRTFWSPVDGYDYLGTYLILLLPSAIPFFAAIAGMMLLLKISKTRNLDRGAQAVPRAEMAAMIAAALLPFVAVTLSMLTTKAYVYRYALPTALGLASFWALEQEKWTRMCIPAAAGTCVILLASLVWFHLGPTLGGQWTKRGEPDVEHYRWIENTNLPPGVPIVVSPPVLFPVHAQYLTRDLARRLVYPASPDLALTYRSSDSPDRNLIRLSSWSGLAVENYNDFRRRHPQFAVLHRDQDRFEWIVHKLRQEGSALIPIAERRGWRILLCCTPSIAEARTL
jgi:hypothetical protein